MISYLIAAYFSHFYAGEFFLEKSGLQQPINSPTHLQQLYAFSLVDTVSQEFLKMGLVGEKGSKTVNKPR
jgi:hypothetical protein